MKIDSFLKPAAVVAVGVAAVFASGGARAGDAPGEAVGLFKDFSHHSRIVFSGYEGASALTNFPALVRIREGDGGFSAAACAKPNGLDVRFSLADGREIASEVISFNQNGESEFYVRVPVLSGKDTGIFVHWGSASATARDPAVKVWADDYEAVWEMEDEGRFVTDSTAHGIHGSVNGDDMTAAGVVGRCRSFDRSKSQYARIGGCDGENEGFRSPALTWECWVKTDSKPTANMAILSHAAPAWGEGRFLVFDSNGLLWANRKMSYSKWTPGDWHHFAWTEKDKKQTLYVDGASVATYAAASPVSAAKTWAFLIGYTDPGWYKGYLNGLVDEVRISSECKNADYLKASFMNVASNANFIAFGPSEGTLTVCGNEILPEGAEVVPAYGTTEAAAALAASVPSSFEKDGVRWTCLGYSIVADGVLVKTGETSVVSEPWPTDATNVAIAWKWKRQYRVSVTAGENGSVTPVEAAWCDPQAVVTVTATSADAQHAFYRWTGDCPKTDSFTASFDLTVDRPIELAASFGTRHDVASMADLAQAIADADDGDVVLIADGTYTMSELASNPRLTIAKPIAVRAANGQGHVVLDLGNIGGAKAFTLNSSGVVLDGLVVSNGNAAGWYCYSAGALVTSGCLKNCVFDTFQLSTQGDGVVQVDSGWLSGCTFRNCVGKSAIYWSGAVMTKGNGVLIDTCRFLNNTSGYKGVISMTGGLVRNSLFAGNSCIGGTFGGAVEASGGGRFEHCTFACNTNAVANAYGGAVYGGTGISVPLVNCAFADNYVANASNGSDIYGAAPRNCVSVEATNGQDGNVAAAAVFKDVAAGNFAPTGVSPVRDMGHYLAWAYAPTAKDVSGEARLSGTALDAGANEYVSSGDEPLAVNVLASAVLGKDVLEVTFTPIVGGAKAAISYDWDFGDGATSTEESPTHTYVKAGYFRVKLVITEAGTGRTDTFDKDGMIKVLPSVCYVRAVLPGDETPWTPAEPYATYETAATNVKDAMLIAPSRIELGEGKIPISASGAFGSVEKIHYVGRGPDKTTIDCTGFLPKFSGAGAVIDSLTFYNAGNTYYESGVQLNAGVTITNCHVYGCGSRAQGGGLGLDGAAAIDCDISSNNQTWNGCGVFMSGGATAERCVITNNLVNGGVWFGSGGGRLRNCLIANNVNGNGGGYDSGSGGGAFAWKGTGILENCTIVSNSASVCAGAAYVNSGYGLVMTNGIAWGNWCTAKVESPVDGFYAADGLDSDRCSFVRCCATDLVGLAGGNIGGDPQFNLGRKAKLPFYAIGSASPCKNAGVKAGWMLETTDLIGNPRVFGGKPDMGCYESQTGGFLLIVR